MMRPFLTAADRAALDQSAAGARQELQSYVATTRDLMQTLDSTEIAIALARHMEELHEGQIRGLLMAAIMLLSAPEAS